MTTTTALSITRAARIGADLVDRAERAGMTTPDSISVSNDGVTLILTNWEDKGFLRVIAWAKWLGVEYDSRTNVWDDEDVHFVDAIGEAEGIRVKVTTNWRTPHKHAPLSGTYEQIDAHEAVADCACGNRIRERYLSAGTTPWTVTQ